MVYSVAEVSAFYARCVELYPDYNYPLGSNIAVVSTLSESDSTIEVVATLENGRSILLFIGLDPESGEVLASADC